MSDLGLYTVPAGSDVGQNLPPLDLPKVDRAPPVQRTPLQVTVTKPAPDPYAQYSDAPPTQPDQAQSDPYAQYADAPPENPKGREIGAGESAARGLLEGASFGLGPAIAGVIGAGMSREEREELARMQERGEFHEDPAAALAKLVKGLGRLGYDHLIAPALGVKPDASATDAYQAERKRALDLQESAAEQNPKSYIGGQLAGAIATPAMGAIKGASTLGRVAHAAKSGAVTGGLYGTGEAVSEGKDLPDVLMEGAKGVGTGAAFGGLGSGIIEGAGKVAKRVGNIVRGAHDPEAEAARGILGQMSADATSPAGMGIDREAYQAAKRSGMPVTLMDMGGQGTRDLGRGAANLSPRAMAALETATAERLEGRPQRIHGAIHRIFGGGLDAKLDQEAIKAKARLINRPRYASAYRAGDRPIWSPEMERLSGSPAVQAAIKSAITTGKDKAIKDGFGAFNPGVRVTQDGKLILGRTKSGVPTYPNIQFWDYVQRDLKDMATKVEGRENDKAATLNGLHHDLNAELDKLVPEFKSARQGAHAFFKAEDASEAGRKFVMMNADPREAKRALASMNPGERELFARAFADELAQSVLKTSNTMGTIKRAFTSPLAREKIETALGPVRAKELETMLRAEVIAQRTRDALGNSTTARQQQIIQALKSGGHGIAGAGAVGAIEAFKDTDYDPKSILGTALIIGALRHGAHKIDMRVFRHIGEMLASENPAVLRKGVQAVARSPQLFNALRNGTEVGMRITAHDLGPERALAGGAAVLEHIMAEDEAGHHGHDDPNAAPQPNQ